MSTTTKPHVTDSVFKKTSSEKYSLKLAKKEHLKFKRKLDVTYNKRRPKWLVTTQLSEIKKLMEMSSMVQLAA